MYLKIALFCAIYAWGNSMAIELFCALYAWGNSITIALVFDIYIYIYIYIYIHGAIVYYNHCISLRFICMWNTITIAFVCALYARAIV